MFTLAHIVRSLKVGVIQALKQAYQQALPKVQLTKLVLSLQTWIKNWRFHLTWKIVTALTTIKVKFILSFKPKTTRIHKVKQVKSISNPHYKRKSNFSKFKKGESTKSIRQKCNLSSSQYKRRYIESFKGYPWPNPRKAYKRGYTNDYKCHYL